MKARAVLAISVLWASALGGLLAACSEDVVGHIFRGRKYHEDEACLEKPGAVDIVSGNDPGEGCPVGCLVRNERDGGRSVYLATTCPPYPPDFARSDETEVCKAASRALAKNVACTDAGAPKVDASSSVDASSHD